jgi:hypothetical protein
MAGDRDRSARSLTNHSSQASAAASGYTQRSASMPSARALPADIISNAAAWSTAMMAFMYFVV